MSFVILIQTFGISIYDISQFDTFLEHAQFHSEQYGDNVFVFISKHYGELKADHEKEHQEEKKDHEQLPFHHNACSHFSFITDFVLILYKEGLKTTRFSEKTETNFYYQVSYSSQHSEGLFQPPQYS